MNEIKFQVEKYACYQGVALLTLFFRNAKISVTLIHFENTSNLR